MLAEKSSTKSKLWAPLYSINMNIHNDSDNDSELKLIDDALTDKLQWLCVIVAVLHDKNLKVPGWWRYHASCKRKPIDPPSINTISPLLRDKVHTLNMQAQCMLLNLTSVKFLNEGQTTVDTYNQPLFALSMKAKYRNLVLFNDYVVLFAALHIEQCFLGIHTDLNIASGLLKIMNHLKFTTIGLSGLKVL